MPTLSGARRLGYPPAAIRNFWERAGITKQVSVIGFDVLEGCVREELDAQAERRMAVLDPLKVVLENVAPGTHEITEVPNHPQQPELGVREIAMTREIWIEREDFMEDPPKKFYRLGPGRCVRLRGGPIIRCTGFEKNDLGEVTLIHAEMIPGTTGADTPEGIECRAAIHWVDAANGIEAEVRLYDRLFTVEDPDGAEGGFLSVINPDSLKSIRAWVEPSLAEVGPEFSCQFERIGYFVSDLADHQPGIRPVFNRTVALRDSWAKKGS
jgi:glutaminyl-tRNA synthetase